MTNIQNLNNNQLEEEFALINPQQELTESEKNIIKQLPEVIFAINDYFTSLNSLYLKKAEELFADFSKNDLSIEANPNLNEDITQEINSNTQRLANSFKSSIEVGKKMEIEKKQNSELVQKNRQLEVENYHKEVRIRQLEQQLGGISADFALTLALSISHKIKNNPQAVAQEIIKITDCPNLEYTITEQGYINFSFPTNYYQHFFAETLAQKGQNLQGEKKDIRVDIEYVSANPTGYLHLAHFRHAAIGNTLANVYQFCGYQVVREYYVNDRGGQINSLVGSIFVLYHQLQGITVSYPGKTEYREVLELILTQIRHDLAQCGIKFDIWFSETSLYEKKQHLDLIRELQAKNLIYSQEGATFFRSSLGGDDKDRVIIKQDSDYTYFFSDILYHQDKLKRADTIINVMGADHHGYISRIKSACQLLGYKPETIQIILVQMVDLLTEGGQKERFSKRAGNTIDLEEALQYMDMNQLKFFLLEKEPNQPLSINNELLKENQEKTRLYYIQYAHARCHQIFQKAQERGIDKISSNIDLLKGQNERKIFNLLIRFSLVLENIVEENKPHHLIHYLYELTQVWQVYYQNSVILETENPELTSQKLLLVKNIQIILKLGLNLMGIEAPERMQKI
ncbi:26235_t:CDS:2 [Gigaspora margarita]|uniref:arginine--tRNA ligase n=1 Tax=Gigaspora margarita TaxID=4874 RepID=A0ABM8VVE2_GIGMA|nr:26235_t:CDS:2 [Gigaspora margarita]